MRRGEGKQGRLRVRCIVVKVHPFINPWMHNLLTVWLLRFPTHSPEDSFNCKPAFYESPALYCMFLLITNETDCDVALGGPRRGP